MGCCEVGLVWYAVGASLFNACGVSPTVWFPHFGVSRRCMARRCGFCGVLCGTASGYGGVAACSLADGAVCGVLVRFNVCFISCAAVFCRTTCVRLDGGMRKLKVVCGNGSKVVCSVCRVRSGKSCRIGSICRVSGVGSPIPRLISICNGNVSRLSRFLNGYLTDAA